MKKYNKPVIIDEYIEIEDIVLNSPVSDVGDAEEIEND